MNRALAMSGMESPSEVSADPSRSRNIIDEDDGWVIVKKQQVTILIPPLSPGVASPQAGTPRVSSRQTSLPRMSRRNYNSATKKQVTIKKSQESSLEGLGIDAAPIVKFDWTKQEDHGVEGPSHQAARKATSSLQNTYELGLPIISSNLTNKVLRARLLQRRLLQRRVAQFGGLRNWLLTCGLGWFVNILDSEKMGMYQIASLTMNQLKEMGLIAVGPRRKLIHAIDSLCKPRQFEMFS